MSSQFYLKIIASDKVFYEGQAQALVVPCIDGEKEILAFHENAAIAIDFGNMRFQTPDGEWREAVIGIGLAEMVNNRAVVVADTVERPEDIDEIRAQHAKERAEERLRQKQSLVEYNHSKASLARAMSRLSSKGKHQKSINL